MKEIYPTITIILAFITNALESSAQINQHHTLNTSGNSATVGNMLIEWSVGETATIHTASAGDIIITNGLLQPQQAPLSISPELFSKYDIKIYPNPTPHLINIKSNSQHFSTLYYQLIDLHGKIVHSQEESIKPGENIHTLSLQFYASGAYILVIKDSGSNQAFSQSFTIQKL